jgi:hypothetical protein
MLTKSIRGVLTSTWFDRYARFGYAAKGVAWGVVGIIALRLALGGFDEQADFYGALAEIDEQPLNAVLLVLLSVGLLGYAGWRLVQGAMDVEGEGSDARGWFKRLSYIVVGLWYGVFGVYTLGILAGWSTEEDEVQDWTAMALGWPAGEWLVGGVGAIIIATGLLELYYAFAGKFEVEIGSDHLGRFEKVCVMCTGWYGHAARGVVYAAVGFFAVRAAVEFDPDEARGLADTFRELLTQPHGRWIVGFVAAGFIAFGLYCLLLAFHRHIPNEGMFRGRNGRNGDAGDGEGDADGEEEGEDADGQVAGRPEAEKGSGRNTRRNVRGGAAG